MGNREDLLDGAVRCLREKGWEGTTVRDIARAAGVSHAAIGYHYGSREALLAQALIKAVDEWGEEIGKVIAAGSEAGSDSEPGSSPEGLEALWNAMIRSFTEQSTLWRATILAFVQSERVAPLREQLAAGQEQGRRGAAASLLGVAEEDVSDHDVRTLGSVQMALIPGIMMQWLLDPERAPSGAEVIEGLRTLARLIDHEPSRSG